MWASDSTFIPTGFSNQSNYICRQLSQKYEILYWSHQYGGVEGIQVAKPDGGLEPWYHIPAHVGPYGQGNMEAQIRRLQPKIVSWLCDSFMLTQAQPHSGPRNDWVIKMINNIRKDGLTTKFMHYYPLDSPDVYAGLPEELEAMDVRVAMSKFARDFVKKETGLDSYYIPHCTDTNLFIPMADEEKARLRERANLKDKFVIGSVGRNQSRKMPHRLAYIMSQFCEDKHDIVCLMHCDPFDPQAGVDTKQLINESTSFIYSNYTKHLKEKLKEEGFKEVNMLTHRDKRGNEIRFTGVNWTTGFPQANVNEVYNCMDVHTMPTTGEGFGITTIEAMACGLPNAITDTTSTRELLLDDGQCGIPVPFNNFINGGLNTKRVLVDHTEYVNILNQYYESDKLRKRHGELGREKAVSLYSLTAVLPQWIQMFNIIEQGEETIKVAS